MTSESEYDIRLDSIAIGAISFAVIVFEIGITRILSVVLWYHFAFLAISLAMLALGAPGAWFSLRSPGRNALRSCLLGAAFAIPSAISLATKTGEWSLLLGRGAEAIGVHLDTDLARVVVTAVILLVPFLFLGAAVCIILMRAEGRRIGVVYGADLLGAALGAATIVPLLHWIPTPQLLAALGLLPAAAAWRLTRSRPALPIAAIVLIGGSLAWGAPYQVEISKSYPEALFSRIHEEWTPTARLTVFERVFWEGKAGLAFGWGMGSEWEPRPLEQLWIEQDGSAGTPITRYTGRSEETLHLFHDVTSAGYQLRRPRRVCIIGAGGGRDILTALKAGADDVEAVELNPRMVGIVSDVFGEFSGNPYGLPGVHPFVREGRSHLAQSSEPFDLIQISLIDSWAATSAGAYALSENYLYTLESLQLYWSQLTDHGVVSISRWMQGDKQMEAIRLALLAAEALRRAGVDEPTRHIAVLQGGFVASFLLSRDPFEGEQLARLDAIARERGFTRHWPPRSGEPQPSQVTHVLTEGPESLEAQGLHLEPPTDDRPFFFQSVRAFSSVSDELMSEISVNDAAGRLPRYLIATVLIFTLMLFFAPFLVLGRLGGGDGFWRSSGYFLAIGLAFMWVEIPFIQRFILHLGHPSYATTVTLSTLLLASGAGSIAASRIRYERLYRLRWLLPLVVALVNLAVTPLIQISIGWPLTVRVVIAVMAMAPMGFCMGFAFPIGMTRVAAPQRAWLWALNGAASVLASASTVALGPYLGFSALVWLGVGGYGVACVMLERDPR